jgi:hypothetical protein
MMDHAITEATPYMSAGPRLLASACAHWQLKLTSAILRTSLCFDPGKVCSPRYPQDQFRRIAHSLCSVPAFRHQGVVIVVTHIQTSDGSYVDPRKTRLLLA